MKNEKELNNVDLNNVSGGKADLNKYLKTFQNDKNKVLVDFDSDVKLELDQTVKYNNDGNIEIILRDKDTAELPTADLSIITGGSDNSK